MTHLSGRDKRLGLRLTSVSRHSVAQCDQVCELSPSVPRCVENASKYPTTRHALRSVGMSGALIHEDIRLLYAADSHAAIWSEAVWNGTGHLPGLVEHTSASVLSLSAIAILGWSSTRPCCATSACTCRVFLSASHTNLVAGRLLATEPRSHMHSLPKSVYIGVSTIV